jgi:hypothetical protein
MLVWILLALFMSEKDPMFSPKPKLTSQLEKYPSIGSPPLLLLEEELPFWKGVDIYEFFIQLLLTLFDVTLS